MNLEKKFEDIKQDHKKALRETAACVVLGSSVIRVFRAGTKSEIQPILENIDIDVLRTIKNETQFKSWFNKCLAHIVKIINDTNRGNNRIGNGYGHATKILTLYVREMVLNRRYFTDKEVRRIQKWLYTPIDGEAMKAIRKVGEELRFNRIKDIDKRSFYQLQKRLGEVAAKVGVPRIWFDDVWGVRELA